MSRQTSGSTVSVEERVRVGERELLWSLAGGREAQQHPQPRPAEATEARLAQLLGGYLGFLAENPRLWNVLFEYSLPEGQTPPEWYGRKVERVLGLLGDALAPLFDANQDDARSDAARTLWAGLHGICSLSGSGKLQVVSSQSVRTMAEGLVANYVAGLRVNRGER